MKKEVSCRTLQALFEGAQRKNLPRGALLASVVTPEVILRNKHEHVDWNTFCTVVANLRAFFTDEEFVELARESTATGRLLGGNTLIGRLLYNCSDLYWWMNTTTKGPGSQLFACVTPSTEKVGDHHLRVTLSLAPDHRYCREFFLLSKGGLEATPTIIGLPPARVEMREIADGAVYEVFYPRGGGTLSWLRRGATWPFSARAIARELKQANEVLLERYKALEEAQREIQHQALQLQTAFSISEVIRKNLDLDATMAAVGQSLIDVAHFVAAEVIVFTPQGREGRNRSVVQGAIPSAARRLNQPLEARGTPVGSIFVWLQPEADARASEELLHQVAPTIAMEINDAVSYTLLSEYRTRESLMQHEFSRRQMESQEGERKRLAGELHDGLAQDLLVASNRLQQFLEEGEDPHYDLRQVASLLQGSIESVREISANLHPHHLDRLGFVPAIEAMMDKLRRTSALEIEGSFEALDGDLPKETELHLYRILQEGLTNIVRHASASRVRLSVKKNFGVVEVFLVDDGKGFDVSDPYGGKIGAGARHGFGLASMAERARIFGGVVKIESSPGMGTTVHVIVPCKDEGP